MADNRITFSIGSTFNGEGWTKFSRTVQSSATTVNKMKGAMGGALASISSLDGEVGKAVQSLNGLIMAFQQFGTAGAAIAGVNMAVQWLVEEFKSLSAELDAIVENQSAQLADAAAARVTQLAETSKNAFGRMKEAIQQNDAALKVMTDTAVKMANAVARVADSQGAASISAALITNFNDALAAEKASIAELTAARGAVTVAVMKESEVRRQEADKVAAAEAEVETATRAKKEILDKLNLTHEMADALEKNLNEIRIKSGTKSAEYLQVQGQINELKKSSASLELDLIAREGEIKVATMNVTAARNAQTAAVNAATLTTQQLQEKESALIGAKQLSEDLETSFQYTQEEATAAKAKYTELVNAGIGAEAARQQVDAELEKSRLEREEDTKNIHSLQKAAKVALCDAEKAYREALEEGYKGQEAYNAAMVKCKEAAEKLAEEQSKAVSAAGGSNAGTAKTKSESIEAIKEGIIAGVGSTTVNIDPDKTMQGVDKSKEVMTVSKLQRLTRDDERKDRARKTMLYESAGAIKAFQKGELSKEQAKKLGEWLKDHKVTGAELEDMSERAIKSQLISDSEMKKQRSNIQEIKDVLDKVSQKVGLQ